MSNKLFEAVSTWGPVVWGRGSEVSGRTPLLAWRYSLGHEEKATTISHIVNEFNGKVTWVVRKERKNWVIEPKKMAEFRKSNYYRVDVEAADEFARLFPETVRAALEDLPLLAQIIQDNAPH